MKRSRYTEEQIIGILKEQEAGTPVAELCRKDGMSDATFYAWKSKYGGLEVSEAKGLRALEHRSRASASPASSTRLLLCVASPAVSSRTMAPNRPRPRFWLGRIDKRSPGTTLL